MSEIPRAETGNLTEICSMLPPIRILLTGANGLLGQKIIEQMAHRNIFELYATGRGDNRNRVLENYTYIDTDITDPQRLENLFRKVRPDVVIHTAAMTNVDQCEQERGACWRINVSAVEEIVKLCAAQGSRLVHISTDFIFDGLHGPYDESAKPHALSWYGESKLRAEQVILESGIPATILRTILLYGVTHDMSRSNIVLWARESLASGKQISVVNDQYRSPTLAEDLATAVILAVVKERTGTYHISGPEVFSILELVRRVANFWGLDESLITEVSSTTLNQRAKRPPRTGFIILKAEMELGYRPHAFREGLALVDSQLRAMGILEAE